MKAICIFFYIITIFTSPGYGQSQVQVINSSGGSSQNKGYSIQWNIGELALVNQMNSTDGGYILTNGFIQPLTGDIPALNKIEFNPVNVRMFPNPTHDILEIKFFQIIAGKISVQLSNAPGHIIYTHVIPTHGLGLVEKINMKGLTNGIYKLSIKTFNPVTGRYDIESGSYPIIKL